MKGVTQLQRLCKQQRLNCTAKEDVVNERRAVVTSGTIVAPYSLHILQQNGICTHKPWSTKKCHWTVSIKVIVQDKVKVES